jgi:hypothetical protein
VNYAYQIHDIVRNYRLKKIIQDKIEYSQKYEEEKLKELGKTAQEAEAEEIDLKPPPTRFCYFCCKKDFPPAPVLEDALEKGEKAIREVKDHMDVDTEKDLFCGVAFVIFEKQSDVIRVLHFFEISILRRLISFIVYKIFRCKNSKIDNRYLDGNRIVVQRAPEPTDIFWENLGVKTQTRVKKT